MLTEFGGIAFVKCPSSAHPQPWGYATAADEQEFHCRYRALMDVVNDIGMFSGYCYTQFADTFQEANGLLCADRSPKLPLEVIAAATRKETLVLTTLSIPAPT